MKISITSYKAWKDCRRRWFLAHKLGLEPATPQTPLLFGSGIHAALGTYYRKRSGLLDEIYRDWMELEVFKLKSKLGAAYELYRSEIEELVTLGVGVLKNYQMWAESEGRDDFEVLETEVNFELPVADGLLFRGRIDGLLRADNGLLWIFEHKTASNFGNLEWTAYDAQCTGYVWAASQLADSPVQGMLFNFLRKEVPEPPKTLANGRLSVDKRQLTTYDHYLRAIYEGHHTPAHYADILSHLQKRPNPFFQRIWETRNPSQIDQWLDNFVTVAREMQSCSIYPNQGYHCAWCPFESPCHALDLGADVNAALAMYRVRESTDDDFLPAAEVDWRAI